MQTNAVPYNQPSPQQPQWLKIDGTINLTSIGAVVLLLASWAVQFGSVTTRLATVESNQVAQSIANAKQAEANHSIAMLVEHIQTQLSERQDRMDFRQDRAELHNQK